jgi:superfamily II DNA or RNA helicase
MGNSKFFTNEQGNSLFDKFKGIIEDMAGLHSFHAVVGYFRSSGYFKIRKEFETMENPPKIQILVGINVDDIFRRHNKSLLFLAGDKVKDEAWEQFRGDFVEDVRTMGYYEDLERGIMMLADDLKSGRVEMKMHATKDLHAKFYLFLPEKHTPHSSGSVIMGSSNMSDSGLGLTKAPRYELNVEMRDYDDVKFCKDEFDKLWREGVPLTYEDIEAYKKDTHLGQTPTPWELYMKLLIDFFGEQAEDDFTLEVPDGFMELKYQKDAVGQGYQMLKKYNGFFLADVVGLGKTVIATMIAKQFIEANGVRNSRILVVFPPALEYNWRDTFQRFKIGRYADFISCGSLDKILEESGGYRSTDEYDMVLVDEAHRFRSDGSNMYDSLQRICKTDRAFVGHIGDHRKKVMLISATPLNNRPDDLYNLLRLFQDQRKCNIDGIPNLQNYFSPKIAAYKELMSPKHPSIDVKKVDEIYNAIRRDVIDKVTVRRTRENIEKYAPYMEDLQKQGIKFPQIEKPREVEYILPPDLKLLFEKTMSILVPKADEDGLSYARYRAIENLTGEFAERYANAEATSRSLAIIYRTHMVKRLESSFHAFRKSLDNLRRATRGMVDMFAADKVIIAPDLKVKELQDKGFDLDWIIEEGINKLKISKEDFVYPASAFKFEFLESLNADIVLLDNLIAEWDNVNVDPKLDRFIEYLETKMLDRNENPTGKLVVFSESKDTITYLTEQLEQRLGRRDIISVSSEDRKGQFAKIQANFDANFSGTHKNEYNIIIATDVLAEGVNLHRANVIVNYDTPWNASRLMQRIGRVNRIGSVAGVIVNYMFYPSEEGDAQIRLYKNALAKLQGFHSALGEDSQIYSREEIVGKFELFNKNVGDYEDKIRLLLDEARKLYANDPETYERIKNLPVKSRTARSISESGKDVKEETTLVYISSSFKQEFYRVENGVAYDIGSFAEAAELFRAEPEEKPYVIPSGHFKDVAAGQSKFDTDVTRRLDDTMPAASDKDNYTEKAKWLLREIWRKIPETCCRRNCDTLTKYVELGTYTRLSRDIAKMERKYRKAEMTPEAVETQLRALVVKYHNYRKSYSKELENIATQVILSETFI